MDYKHTETWAQYQSAVSYKSSTGVYDKLRTHQDMYEGRQWANISNSNDLPKPVFNILDKVISYKVSAIKSSEMDIIYNIPDIDSQSQDPVDLEYQEVADLLSAMASTDWERLQMDHLNLSGLVDAAVTGDYILYSYFDPAIKTSDRNVMGAINVQTIDSVNYYVCDPANTDDQTQDYIIIASRDSVKKTKEYAKPHVSELELSMIVGDSEYLYQTGKNYNVSPNDSDKCIVLTKFYKDAKTGTVRACKSTRHVTLRDWDTGLHRYPVSRMAWKPSKNCIPSISEIESCIPNQVAINKLIAMAILSTSMTAFPKILLSSKVSGWTNKIGGVIKTTSDDLSNLVKYLHPTMISADIYKLVDQIKSLTMEAMGATDALFGNIRPDNASAVLVLREAALTPLEANTRRYYTFVEDVARNWLDIYMTYYTTPRVVSINRDGEQQLFEINPSAYKDRAITTKINVGPSNQYSSVALAKTLDNMLASGLIDINDWLELIPIDTFPAKVKLQKILDDRQVPQELDPIEAAINELTPEELQMVDPSQIQLPL